MLWVGIITATIFFSMMGTIIYKDTNVNFVEKYLATGTELCKDHDGLKSFDYSGQYTCNNGIEINK